AAGSRQRGGENLSARRSQVGLQPVPEIRRAGRREARDNAAALGAELVERAGEADGRAAALGVEVGAEVRAVEVGDHPRVEWELDRDEVGLSWAVIDDDQPRGAADLGICRLRGES